MTKPSYKIMILILSLAQSFLLHAEESSTPIIALFDAMREHNGDKLKEQFTPNALLQRALNDGTARDSDIEKFASNISKASAFLDEQLLDIKVHKSGNLASVWTPYVFYADKQLSHCGLNSFQLIETKNE
jgi:hypothetical protein